MEVIDTIHGQVVLLYTKKYIPLHISPYTGQIWRAEDNEFKVNILKGNFYWILLLPTRHMYIFLDFFWLYNKTK